MEEKREKRNIRDDISYFAWLVEQINNERIEKRFYKYKTEQNLGIVNYLNKKLKELIEDILAKRVSLENFTIVDVISFSKLLQCQSLDQEILGQLYHLLYGEDEKK